MVRKIRDAIQVLFLFAALLGLVALFGRYAEEQLTGTAYVVDGDSLKIDGQEVRLFGIDAPEFKQQCHKPGADRPYPCGKRARDHLRSIVSGNVVECSGFEKDKYERLLAQCTSNGADINQAMVEAGWAVAFGSYFAEEKSARTLKLGIWSGEFVDPAEWRRDAREAHRRGFVSSLFNW